MKPLNYLVAVLGVAGACSLTALAHADSDKDCEPRDHHHAMGDERDGDMDHPGMRHKGFAKMLNLTETQQKTLDDARAKHEQGMHDSRDKLRAAEDALQKAGAANASDAELNKLSANVASLIAQQQVQRIKAHQQLVSILTPEQKQKLTQWEADRKDEWRHDHPMMK